MACSLAIKRRKCCPAEVRSSAKLSLFCYLYTGKERRLPLWVNCWFNHDLSEQSSQLWGLGRRGASKRSFLAAEESDVQIDYGAPGQGSHTQRCRSSSGPLPLLCPSHSAQLKTTESTLESSYTMSWVNCNISWIGLESIHPKGSSCSGSGNGNQQLELQSQGMLWCGWSSRAPSTLSFLSSDGISSCTSSKAETATTRLDINPGKIYWNLKWHNFSLIFL